MIVSIIETLRNNLKLTAVLAVAIIIGLAVWGAFFVDMHHAHTEAEHLPFFWALFGLLGGALLILVATLLGKLGIMTREDYYDD
ncbi:MAG: hypothetical protein ACQES8_01505 [Thermodesulfobacteriota bacterium]